MASAEQKKAMKAAMAIAAAKEGECVRVVVRVRPLSRKETQDGRNQCCFVDEEACTVSVKNPKVHSTRTPFFFLPYAYAALLSLCH